jgi:fucose permease
MRAAGVGGLLAASTALATLGVAGYALSPSALGFGAAAMIVGWGSGAIDSGLNAYAAHHFTPRHMAWLHAAYSAGAALGAVAFVPFVGARWRQGYTAIAATLLLLCVAFFYSRTRWSASERGETSKLTETRAASGASARAALGEGRVQLQALLFFVYSGVELGVGSWGYTILTQARGLSPRVAALLVTAYWTCLFIGRVLSGFIVQRVGTVTLLRVGTGSACVGALAFALPFVPLPACALGLGLIGLSLAPIYPGLMSDTPRRVGADVSPHAVGFQVSSATAGAVLLPTLGGVIASSAGLQFTAAMIAACALSLFALHELLLSLTESDERSPSSLA